MAFASPDSMESLLLVLSADGEGGDVFIDFKVALIVTRGDS